MMLMICRLKQVGARYLVTILDLKFKHRFKVDHGVEVHNMVKQFGVVDALANVVRATDDDNFRILHIFQDMIVYFDE